MNERAKILRRNQTDAERRLWGYLRDRRLDGCKFRRQHPVGAYVLDLYCAEAKLVIEVDGGQHDFDGFREHDAERTAYLNNQGLRVIRFWNNEVMENITGVLEAIREALGTSPHPQPSDGTTSHSTRLVNNASQVAGYPHERGEGEGQRS